VAGTREEVEDGALTVRFGLSGGDYVSRVLWRGPLRFNPGGGRGSRCVDPQPSILNLMAFMAYRFKESNI
jgi:hypothetical protein